jgi:hypothetical protein
MAGPLSPGVLAMIRLVKRLPLPLPLLCASASAAEQLARSGRPFVIDASTAKVGRHSSIACNVADNDKASILRSHH